MLTIKAPKTKAPRGAPKPQRMTSGGTQPESPINRSLRTIDERINTLNESCKVLQEKLATILSPQTPPIDGNAEKISCESTLETALLQIRENIESNIYFLDDLIKRLQI